VLVAQACNPSYSGSRNQEDQGSKPAWGPEILPSKNLSQKRAGGVIQGVGLEFKFQYHRKEKKKEREERRKGARKEVVRKERGGMKEERGRKEGKRKERKNKKRTRKVKIEKKDFI
jgi:hypothetical protein